MPALVAFDLDDTLYKEMDYVASGYRTVAAALAESSGADARKLYEIIASNRPLGFEAAIDYLDGNSPLCVDDMIEIYRAHEPDIKLSAVTAGVLAELKQRGHRLLLITDGSPRHQGAKIRALGLNRFFAPDDILISQVTGGDKFTSVPTDIADRKAREAGISRRFYVGDNLSKDFLWPNRRGWTSVMLLDTEGRNVFPQNVASAQPGFRPKLIIDNLQSLLNII